MARCKLDLEHHKFVKSIGGDKADGFLISGLKALQVKLAKDHKLSIFFPHPMPGYPQYKDKIWKWDFGPEGDHSATRKGWRLFAYVEDPNAPEPIPATAFHVYEKPGPKGNPATYLAGVLKKFLKAIDVKTVEVRFRRQTNSDGKIISLCLDCYDMVANSADEGEVEILEGTHECPPSGS